MCIRDSTEVDPARSQLLFERFISRERGEPPDIDVDFEHQRREEVIQYIYTRYGRERAALTATVITYRTRGALRDVGRALGLGSAQIDALSASLAWWDKRDQLPDRLRSVGLDPAAPRVAKWLALADSLRGFPRHLSQHVGGFVISRGPLARLVPIENAAMPERTVIQWDKDDLDTLGLLKIDVLALGMLSAIHRALDLVGYRLADVPPEDPAVYEMICAADTVGVFQIESRAQMAMLPRLRPCNFYDLVIEVALVRPGPIQGDMVHPYLRRRHGEEAIGPMRPEIAAVLERTCGVPIFQEGELAHGLRYLVDIDSLLRHFGTADAFWQALVPRAVELELSRPLFYALRYANLMLGTPLPESVVQAAVNAPGGRRPGAFLAFMDSLFLRALRPAQATTADRLTARARWQLYVRSHWLRMPPSLLIPHLSLIHI